MSGRPKCRGCGHAAHRDGCRAKGPSGCAPLLDPATGRPAGIACSRTRAPCPCPLGACHTCGSPVAGVQPFPLGAVELDVDQGSAGDPAGTMAVRKLADGTLAGRLLDVGQEPAAGEWRGRLHQHQLPEAAAWLDAQPVRVTL